VGETDELAVGLDDEQCPGGVQGGPVEVGGVVSDEVGLVGWVGALVVGLELGADDVVVCV
jgi:hypothetical protein